MAKKIRKIIPKEIRPALPALAAVFGPSALFGAKGLFAGTALASAPVGIQAALINAATQGVTEEKIDPKQTALSGITAQLGSSLSKYGAGANQVISPSTGEVVRSATNPTFLQSAAQKAGSFLNPQYKDTGDAFKDVASYAYSGTKAALPTITYASSEKIKEMNEKALRDYEASLREQGIMDSAERRNKIFGYFSNAGYDTNEVNAFLDKYGYADGGRVKKKNEGILAKMTLEEFIKDYYIPRETKAAYGGMIPKRGLVDEPGGYAGDIGKTLVFRDLMKTGKYTPEEAMNLAKELEEDDDVDFKGLSSGLEGLKSGFEIATGQPLMGSKPQPTRFGLAEGGIPNTMTMRKTIAELIQAGVIDEEDVEEAVREIQSRAMMSMRAPGMAEGGIMNVSDLNNDKFLEQRAEQYMEEGFSPEEAMDKALDDLKNNRFPGLKDGGMMNLGGREMDMRGGGFIPIGAKERADDVPARLSKNEFVMTADAVRAAGNGSINKGAKRMYDLMNKLESKV